MVWFCFWWFLWTARKMASKSSASFRRERQTNMSKVHTRPSSVRKLKINDEVRKVYAGRDKSHDRLDPDSPVMPPEFWDGAAIGKFYRPVKTQISFRIDNTVLAWLKSKGEGHLTRI